MDNSHDFNEPVAYVYERLIDGLGMRKDVKFLRPVEVGTDLYTSPQPSKPWVGLTDEQIGMAFRKAFPVGSVVFTKGAVDFARAIEAAHGIKGGK